MAKDKDTFGYGGRSEGGDARDVFERHYGEDAWKSKHLGPNYQHKYRGKDGTELGNGSFAERDHKRFEADRAWASASGSWVANANKHAAELYNKHGLDYNDQRKYAKGAGIGDINSKNDVQGILDHIDSQYTSTDELTKAFKAFGEDMGPSQNTQDVIVPEVKDSERMQQSEKLLDDYKAGITGSRLHKKAGDDPFDTRSSEMGMETPTTNEVPDQSTDGLSPGTEDIVPDSPIDNTNEIAANDFKNKYSFNVSSALNLSGTPTRGPKSNFGA
tara:strand:- start:1051 stop:1869 length:819 start_codon:yes stop_codon:yes gene_type:complete